MKRVFQHISLLFLLSAYLLGTVGFGIHECSSSGSINVVLPFKSAHCNPSLHKHCPCCGMHQCHNKSHLQKKCCQTLMHHLDKDYDVNQINLCSQLISPDLTAYLDVNDGCLNLQIQSINSEIITGDPPPILNHSTYSFHSQWRL